MKAGPATELILIRHAPARTEGRLCGRTDVAADLADVAALRALSAAVGPVGSLLSSPALRCRQTAGALWPGVPITVLAALWEQDFGAWEGVATRDLPDLGPLSREALAHHRPPRGESFGDVVARTGAALAAFGPGRSVAVAHAGTIRAALALALADPADALGFDIAPLSATRLLRHGKDWSIGFVNRVAPWP